MNTKVKKACELSVKILDQINQYVADYTTAEGKDVTTALSLSMLQEILEEGFALHNYLIENKLYEGKPAIEINLVQLEKFMNQLTINKENAEKLKLSNAIQVWNQAKIAVAVLAGAVLDEYEPKKK